jgi:hypothetical protein
MKKNFSVIRTGRTWSIVNRDDTIVEGGFFSRDVAVETANEYNEDVNTSGTYISRNDREDFHSDG